MIIHNAIRHFDSRHLFFEVVQKTTNTSDLYLEFTPPPRNSIIRP